MMHTIVGSLHNSAFLVNQNIKVSYKDDNVVKL